jgi:hypothetical protein
MIHLSRSGSTLLASGLVTATLAGAAAQTQNRSSAGKGPALLQDYIVFTVTPPPPDDERLTPQQREDYHKPGGVGTMTGEQYWNARGRGFGGEPDGENTTSCAEENLLGYPGTRYFGSSICVHEFSHGIMRGAIYTIDPEYRKAVEDAYAAAKAAGLSSAQGYPGNNFNEYWATGIEAYVFGSGRGPDTLLAADPRLYELVRQVIPSTKMPGNVYVGRARQPPPAK